VKADKVILMGGAAIALAFSGQSAQAQAVGESIASAPISTNFARDRNVSVRARPRAEYEALGGRLGAFMLYPRLLVTGEYNDNIYALGSNKVGDELVRVQPELTLSSNWSRHALSVYARSTLTRYDTYASEDSDEWQAGVNGRLDIRRDTNLSVSFDSGRVTEPRTTTSTQSDSVVPIQYEFNNVNVTLVKEFNRLRLTGKVDFSDQDFNDGRTALGARVEQDDRDRKQTTGTIRAEYAVSPDTALFVQVAANKRRYDTPIPFLNADRDSDGYEVLAGANFELSALVRGDIGVGYLKQGYDSPIFDDIKGLGVRGQVEWFPTQLTTVTLTGARQVMDSGILEAAGYISSSAAAQVDHELRRNIILTGQLSYAKDDYKDFDRNDKHFRVGVSGTYLMNRNVGLTLGYSYYKENSSGTAAGVDYKVNKVGATLTLQY
jgi:hypothetical protein